MADGVVRNSSRHFRGTDQAWAGAGSGHPWRVSLRAQGKSLQVTPGQSRAAARGISDVWSCGPTGTGETKRMREKGERGRKKKREGGVERERRRRGIRREGE